jgi:hypothetical protein
VAALERRLIKSYFSPQYADRIVVCTPTTTDRIRRALDGQGHLWEIHDTAPTAPPEPVTKPRFRADAGRGLRSGGILRFCRICGSQIRFNNKRGLCRSCAQKARTDRGPGTPGYNKPPNNRAGKNRAFLT